MNLEVFEPSLPVVSSRQIVHDIADTARYILRHYSDDMPAIAREHIAVIAALATLLGGGTYAAR